MFNGGGDILVPQRLVPTNIFTKIVEQPSPKALRFRYASEGRSAGSIPGINSTTKDKTYPTIQIVGYQGKAVVVVSCVTKDRPYRPHPHNLVGREGCRRGVCTLEIPVDTMTVQFSNLGIQCVKKNEIEDALRTREEIRVDPFRTGFSHRYQPSSIDLNTVRLCFQVIREGDIPGKFTVPLKPVVSEPIYDKKNTSDLSITELSNCVSSVVGGEKIILLCEKVAKDDIQVRFYEENSDWEAFGDFQPSQVHKQAAISLKTPSYKTLDINEPVKVFIQLRRPSDGATSESLPFELWPRQTYLETLRHKPTKRPKMEDLRGFKGPERPTSSYGGSISSYGGFENPFRSQATPMIDFNISASSRVQQILDSASPLAWQPPITDSQNWKITGSEMANTMTEQKDPFNLDSGEIKRLASEVCSQRPLPDLNLSSSDMMQIDDQAPPTISTRRTP